MMESETAIKPNLDVAAALRRAVVPIQATPWAPPPGSVHEPEYGSVVCDACMQSYQRGWCSDRAPGARCP